MTRFFSAFFLLLIFLVVASLATGRYFGTLSEQGFKNYLDNQHEVFSGKLLKFELLSYRKTILGAEASLKISSDNAFLDEKLGGLKIIAKLLNGPLFITKKGVSIGSSRWYISLDESAFDEKQRESFQLVFPEVSPYFIIRTGFDGKVYYTSKLNTNISQADIHGVYDLQSKESVTDIILSNLSYYLSSKFFSEEIKADKVLISLKQTKPANHLLKENSVHINVPFLNLMSSRGEASILLNIRSKSIFSFSGKHISGSFKLNIDQIKSNAIPIDRVDTSLFFNNISIQGFSRLSENKAELDNLKQQAQWSLEEIGEFPEGQDQIWQLYEQISKAEKRLKATVLNEIFNENTRIQFKATSYNSSGKSEIDGTLSHIDTQREKSIINRRAEFDKLIWSILQGEASITLDNDLFSYLKRVTPINKSKFQLTLDDNKLLMH